MNSNGIMSNKLFSNPKMILNSATHNYCMAFLLCIFLSINFLLLRNISSISSNFLRMNNNDVDVVPVDVVPKKSNIIKNNDNDVDIPNKSNIIKNNNNNNTSSLLESLSNPVTFLKTITELYNKYGREIAAFRPEMRLWCERTKSCKFCDYEAEMLYMLIRDYKPQRVFEMAPNLGYSTHWILEALHKNDQTSTLHSFDIHSHSLKHMTKKYQNRWKFTLGDYAKLYDTGKLTMDQYDFIFIDALHEPEFSKGYCKRLLAPHKRKSVVAIHDIVADNDGGGRESSEVYKHIAMNNIIHNVFTMANKFMPNYVHPIGNSIIAKVNEIRVKEGIIKQCKPHCHKSEFDTLYINVNNSPSIFFEMN